MKVAKVLRLVILLKNTLDLPESQKFLVKLQKKLAQLQQMLEIYIIGALKI